MIIDYGYKMKLLNNMKIFFKVLIIIFILQSWVKGDDIKDFQIDGISVGDTLLKYMTEDEILIEKKKRENYYSYLGDPIFYEVYSFGKSSQYDYISFFLKSNDKNFIIQAIYGVKLYEKDIVECYKKQNEIIVELENLFKNLKKYSQELPLGQDTSGKSIMKRTYYNFENQDVIAVECYDWHESMQKGNPPNPDILSLSINTKELFSWIN